MNAVVLLVYCTPFSHRYALILQYNELMIKSLINGLASLALELTFTA